MNPDGEPLDTGLDRRPDKIRQVHLDIAARLRASAFSGSGPNFKLARPPENMVCIAEN